MTNQDESNVHPSAKGQQPEVILTKAIQKAIERGYDTKGLTPAEFLMKYELGLGSGMIASRQFMLTPDFAKALWGEPEDEWLGGFVWYSLYEQDSYTFKDADELLNSWVYTSKPDKPSPKELEKLASTGLKATSGMVEKQITRTNKGWQYHLQQMVIADDPIAYLGEHLQG